LRKILVTVLSLLTLTSFGQQSTLDSDGLVVYPFDIESTDPYNLAYLDSIIEPYNIFGLAEYHWNETTLKEEKKFLKYLSTRKSIDKIVIERPFTYSYWLNDYLSSGDTILLKSITDKVWRFDYWQKKDIRYVNYYEFYKWLYDFKKNNNLDFIMVGIDPTQSFDGSLELWSIKQFIDKYELSAYFPATYPLLEKLSNEEPPKSSELKKWAKKFDLEMKKSTHQIENKLKKDYQVFLKFSDGIEAVLHYRNGRNSEFREPKMTKNFISEIKPTDIVYAQFGHPHLALTAGARYKGVGFMSDVVKSPNFESKVLSIYFLCKGCKGRGGLTGHRGIFTEEEYVKIYDSIEDESVLIDFRNAKNSFSDVKQYFQMSIFLSGE